MKIALDPHMHRHLPLDQLCRKAADLGYDYIEVSPRDDLLPWWVRPRAHKARVAEFKKALKDHGVQVASLLPMYRWASPHEDERKAAVGYWKSAAARRRIGGIGRTAAAGISRTSIAKRPGGVRSRSSCRSSRRKA